MSKGVRYILVSTFCFALMGVGVKALPHIPAHEVVFFRAFISLLFCIAWLRGLRQSPWGNRKSLLLARGAFGTAALITFFYTLQHAPLATAVTIQHLSPIFTVLFAAIFLGESISWVQGLCFVVAFIGVLMVKGFDARVSLPILTMGIFSAACSGMAYTIVRKLRETDQALVVVFYFPLVTVPLVGPYTATHWVAPQGWDWLILVGIGMVVTAAQVTLTKALQSERAADISIFNYLGVIYALVLGWWLFDETVPVSSLLGMLLIVFGVTLGTRYRPET